MATQAKWQLSGDYFENCNCNVVCPCLGIDSRSSYFKANARRL